MKLSKLRQSCLNGSVIRDPRFARLHSDPRFQRIVRSKLKVPIDSRFRHMFSEKSFLDPLSIDKRGKPKKREARHSLHQYYKADVLDTTQIENDDEKGRLFEYNVHDSLNIERANDGLPAKADSRNETERQRKRQRSQKNVLYSADDMNNSRRGLLTVNEPDTGQDANFRGEQNCSFKESIAGTRFLSKTDEVSREDAESSDETGDISDSETSSLSVSSSSSDEKDEAVHLCTEEHDDDTKVPTIEKETRRLAVVNMDWDYIKAADLLVLMNSFVPKGGCIRSVSVYPSEFGLQQMKEEALHGPSHVFEPKESSEEDGDHEADMEKLRQYEKAKLRYYYAVVDCDSSATADFLYKSCDGIEFERTSNILDLRFIADDTELKHAPRDAVMEVPVDYEAPCFETRALQHSRVKLTWDDDEPVRVKALRRNFNAEQLNEMDFKTYLASDEENEGSEENRMDNIDGDNLDTAGHDEMQGGKELQRKILREKYRMLFFGGSENGMEEKDTESDKEMEITFHSGLDDLSKRLMEKNRQQGKESVWEAYLRKKKEKRRERMKTRASSDVEVNELSNSDQWLSGDELFSGNDDDINDPFFDTAEESLLRKPVAEGIIAKGRTVKKQSKLTLRSNKQEQRRNCSEQGTNEEDRRKAELELLFTDEHGIDNAIKGYNLKKQKIKGRVMGILEEKLPTVDYDDPRFSALFTSHHFAVDPTDPNFRRSTAQLSSLAERQQKHFQQVQARDEFIPEGSTDEKSGFTKSNGNKRKLELSTLVRSLKRKVGVKGGHSLKE